MSLKQFWNTADAAFYPAYRAEQIRRANRRWNMVWTYRAEITLIADWLARRFLGTKLTGICHGVRNGSEVRWFREDLPESCIVGTDISPQANRTPGVEVWDYHDTNPCWKQQFHFVYSNSLDHSYDPGIALDAWLTSLKPEGVILLHESLNDHLNTNVPVNAHDCLRLKPEALEKLLEARGKWLQFATRNERVCYALYRD